MAFELFLNAMSWWALLLPIALTLVVFTTQYLRRADAPVAVPRIGKDPRSWGIRAARADFLRNGKRLTQEGYSRFKNSLYWVQTCDMDRLVLPSRYIDALRKLPDTHLDSKTAVVERNLGWYNGVDIILKSTTHVDVCRTQLVQNLDAVIEEQIRALPGVFNKEFKQCYIDPEKMHFYNACDSMLTVVNRCVARTLVGEPLCEDEKWLRTCLDSTLSTGLLCRRLQNVPSWARFLVCPFTTAKMKLERSFRDARGLLSPSIEARQPGDANADILQWLIDQAKEGDANVSFLTKQVLFISTAATRSTAASVVNTLFDLAAYPQFQQELRDEIDAALLSANGWCLGALQQMKKLDSFIKESHRLNHHLLLSFNRKVRRPIQLDDLGITVPTGTFICTPAYWTARDPTLYPPGPDGGEFDPWRWVRLREAAKQEGRSQVPYLSSSTSPDNLHWGYGRNACPGRFMAAAEIKLLHAWILTHFEVGYPPEQGTRRPDSVFFDERVHPDPAQRLGFRLRTGVKGGMAKAWQPHSVTADMD